MSESFGGFFSGFRFHEVLSLQGCKSTNTSRTTGINGLIWLKLNYTVTLPSSFFQVLIKQANMVLIRLISVLTLVLFLWLVCVIVRCVCSTTHPSSWSSLIFPGENTYRFTQGNCVSIRVSFQLCVARKSPKGDVRQETSWWDAGTTSIGRSDPCDLSLRLDPP